jgi:hypothetical protein
MNPRRPSASPCRTMIASGPPPICDVVELCGVPNPRIIVATVRIRVLKALEGVMEGHSLSQFLPDYIYEVPESIGRQLIAMNAALEVRSTDPVLVTPADDEEGDVARLAGGVIVVQQDRAADGPDRRRKKRH